MARLIQPSFAKGEIAPSLHGRVDTAAYAVALATAKNAIIHPYGGVSNRPGTVFIGPVKDHSKKTRLIPFEFKASDQYVLEFGDQYMRVIRNDGHVTEVAQNITNATQADPVVITISGHGYTDGDEVYIENVGGMTELNGKRFTVANATTNTFELTDQVTGNDIDGTGFSAYTSGGTAAQIYEITTPYLEADLDELKYVQSADTMTLTHKDYAARDLVRTDHDSWTLSVISFTPEQEHPTGLSISVGTTGSATPIYRVTALQEGTYEESLPALNTNTKSITNATQTNPVTITSSSHGLSLGDVVEINNVGGMTELNGRRFRLGSTTTNTFELAGVDGTGYSAYTSGGDAHQDAFRLTNSASTADNTVSWTAVDGAAKYAIYRDNSDEILGLIGETTSTSFHDTGFSADTSVSHPEFRDTLRLEDTYPGTSTYFEQRQVYGGSVNKPDTAHYSRVGDRNNFSTARPAANDDSFSATLASRQVNEIRHFIPLNDLIVFTSGGEWRVNSGNDTAFSINSIRQKPQSFWGTSHIQPVVIGNVAMFVAESGRQVRSIGYSFQIDGYTGTDMSLLANHMLQDYSVVDWSVQHSPETRLYMCREDGAALSFTFDNEQEVIAWTTWETEGEFERTTQLRHSASETEDKVYFIVKRTVNGSTVRYIEKLHTRTTGSNGAYDGFFVDCGLTLDNPITITGISTANPAVVTAPSHGLSDGDLVDILDVTWEPNVDKYFNETQPVQAQGRYKIANTTTNTFELTKASDGTNVDGSGWNAYKSGGAVRKAVSSVSGLDHLEGETLVANCDGDVVRDLTVSDGAVTFSREYSQIRIGLPYITDIQTLNIEGSRTTIQGLPKKISRVTVRFNNSRGMLIGPGFSDKLTEMKQREFERLGEPTRLLTGDKEVVLKPDWNSNGRIAIRQKDPMPLTVLAVIPDVEVGDV